MNWLRHDLLAPDGLLGELAYGILFFAAAALAARLVGKWGRRLAARSDLGVDVTALGFMRQLLQVFCFLLAAILYAHLIPALQRLGTALLASAGVISLVIGLAAQNTLGQLIAGISLLLYRPFGIGDVIVLCAPTGKETGAVREFTLGYTKLQTDDGRWIIVPNSVMASVVIIRLK